MFGRPSPAPLRTRLPLAPLAAASITALAYLNAFSTPFVCDDYR